MTALSRDEALKLLGDVTVGRVAFSHHALPAIRPVNHVVDGGAIIIRTHTGAALLGPAGTESVVAYEADDIDPVTHTGWSVVVTGTATLVDDPGGHDLLPAPWIGGAGMDQIVRISTDIVTGYRLTRRPG